MEKKRVLIIDNDDVIQVLLGNALRERGYVVDKAYDGMEALQRVYAAPPDVILLDLIMPRIEGDRVCRYLKGNPKFHSIPIIILSGVASETEKTIRALGADAYVVKERQDVTLRNVLTAIEGIEGAAPGERPAIFGIDRVTSRQLVMELLELKSHYESILQSMVEGVIETDADGKTIFANHEALRILSRKEGEVLGVEIENLIPMKTGRDGALPVFPRESFTASLGDRTVRVNFSPLHQDEKVTGYLAALEDVTERERLKWEVEEAALHLAQAEKLAATSKLAAGIAHEIKNPLNSLSFAVANIEEVLSSSGTPAKVRRTTGEHLALVRSDIERIKVLVDRFMTFARPREMTLTRADVAAILRTALKSIALQAKGQKVTVTEAIDGGSHEAMVEEEELFRCFLNLLTNSLEAMPGGGALTVSCARSHEGVRVTVLDTGEGIPPDIQDKVYDIFFTTKSSGSGLGLSQVYRTIESLRGWISLRSPVAGGRGTEFTLIIPETGSP